jgi:hypothetical protein
MIDLDKLRRDRLVVYLNKEIHPNKMVEANFSREIRIIERHRHLSKATLDYYAHMIQIGKRPLLFHRVPHILYKGSIAMKMFEAEEMG